MKLIDILLEIGDIYQNNDNTWTHFTKNEDLIKYLKLKKKWVGRDENLENFDYEVQNSRFSITRANRSSPNFLKGKAYPGAEGSQYLITMTPKEKYPGDDFESLNWEKEKFPFIPNLNGGNKKSFKDSMLVGVLRPEYRDIDNFRFYEYNEEDKKYHEFDIEKKTF